MFFLTASAGAILFVMGLLSTLAFLFAQTPVEMKSRGVGDMPAACEAGFLSHGDFFCWYTIPEHALLFLLSVGSWIGGYAIIVWARRRYLS